MWCGDNSGCIRFSLFLLSVLTFAICDNRTVFQDSDVFPLGLSWRDFMDDQIVSLPANPTIASENENFMSDFVSPPKIRCLSSANRIGLWLKSQICWGDDRRWVRRRYIAPFVGTRLQMTISDKPNS